MPTLSRSIDFSEDDVHERQDGSGGAFGVSTQRIESAASLSVATIHQWRFRDVTIPQGATILSATVTVYAKTSTWNDANLDIYAHDVDASPAPTNVGQIYNRVRTTASAAWVQDNLASSSSTPVAHASPSLVSVIQEIVDRPGWAAGNPLSLLTVGRNDYAASLGIVDFGFGDPPFTTLDVEYTTGQDETGGSTATVTVTVAGAGAATETASDGATATVTTATAGEGSADQSFTITAVVDGSDVDLSWTPQAGATGYAVERDGEIVAWDVQVASYTDVAPGEGDHTYRVGVIL